MFHKSELEEFAHRFPQDERGYVPTHGDCWREMKFDHADQDPDEAGISKEEHARRLEYLDRVWWPDVLAKVNQERLRLEKAYGESFMKRWEEVVNEAPPRSDGFEVQ